MPASTSTSTSASTSAPAPGPGPGPAPRTTGRFRTAAAHGESVGAFVPLPLPPADPPLDLGAVAAELARAETAVARLGVAGAMVPNPGWFLYGFVRKEAAHSSQIEGTQATLRDVVAFEATRTAERPADVEEICNLVDAIDHARRRLHEDGGLPISVRLLCEIHHVLMRGARGEDEAPGEIRRSQNRIGGDRPSRTLFVPPPADEVPAALAALERWIHADDPLPPLVKAGLAHVQFETIHPFLDGNGRIGRLLVTLLVEHWGLLDQPLLYLSLALQRRRRAYSERLTAVRERGDWEGWTAFFLEAVAEAADDGVRTAHGLHALVGRDRAAVLEHERSTVAAVRLLERLPSSPVVTVPVVCERLGVTPPTARKAIEVLEDLGVLHETSGKRRDRVYAYAAYLRLLTDDA